MTGANGWSVVPLGDVVSHRKEFIQIDDLMTYKRCRVKLHAQGVVLRDEVAGSLIKTKSQQVCRKDEFLVAEIDAKMGGFGIVPECLEEAVVSSHYFLFVPDRCRLEPEFLRYYSMTPAFREQVTARGSTNYAAIRPSHVLTYTIPLPKLDEQRRIVTRIERLVGKIEEARHRVQCVAGGWRALLRSMFSQIATESPRQKMGEVAPLIRRKAEPRLGEEYPELGIRSFGKGTFHKPSLDYVAIGSKKLYRIHPGDLVFNNVFAWEGAIAVAQPEDEGRFGSHRFITCVPKEGTVTADFLWFYFSTPEGLERIGEASPGGAGRNRTLGLEKLAEIEVPVPPFEQQRRFGRLLEKVRVMQAARDTERTKLDAFIPSILDRAFRGAL
ncbi:MAG TPA: restriction endonuclease subunit S [Pirellulales bacterium]|jgi:type I restriction enzyme S subunit|nr:restriction endonuclease subunit S [Pirellulales bacterium]